MRIITLEEHFTDADVSRAGAPTMQGISPDWAATYSPGARGGTYSPTPEMLADLGDGRLADMDEHGIGMQVLSCLMAQQVPADVAPDLVGRANDRLATAVREHPGRFAAFAALPTTAPDAAADELRRCREELGMVATMVFGRTDGEFLSAPRFSPVLQAMSDTRTPLYLHPSPPPPAVFESDYAGFETPVSVRLSTAGWGWHNETAVHFLHLVLAGVLDRFPDLQIVLGHWGELLPFYIDRFDDALPQAVTGLDRPVSEYLRRNVHVTPSGIWTQAALQFCVTVLGVDRIMWAVDYPFVGNDRAVEFLEAADLSDEDREAIAHGNAERLLEL